jgi:hypothetical protein
MAFQRAIVRSDIIKLEKSFAVDSRFQSDVQITLDAFDCVKYLHHTLRDIHTFVDDRIGGSDNVLGA